MENISVQDILKEAEIGVSDKSRTIATSSIPKSLSFPLVAVICINPFARAIFIAKKIIDYKKENEAKEMLYKEAIAKQNAVIKALKAESKADKERIKYLENLNILLQKAIKELS